MSFPAFTGTDTACPKCTSVGMTVTYAVSTCIILSAVQHSQPPPLEDSDDNPHLCRQCVHCGTPLTKLPPTPRKASHTSNPRVGTKGAACRANTSGDHGTGRADAG